MAARPVRTTRRNPLPTPTDLDVDALLAEVAAVLRWPGQAGVLLTGSRAEAVSQRSSNLNLLVLGGPRSWVTGLRGAGVVVRPMTLLDNVIVTVHDIEVSLDIVDEAARDRLTAVLTALDVLDDPAGDPLALPALDLFELRLMARLAGGTVVQSPELVREWARLLQVHRFRSYYVACTYLVAGHYLRKSLQSAAEDDHLGAVLRSTTAAEHLAYSALAMRGQFVYESKNLSRQVLAALRRDPAAPGALRELGDLVRSHPDPAGRAPVLRRWSAELLARAAADPSLADAHRLMRSDHS
jgi:hypothetical protein